MFGSSRLLLLFCFCFSTALWASDNTPSRTARLAYLQGSVTVQRGDNTGIDAAQLNMPLVEGQRVTTGADGQAEVEFEDGSLVRVTPQSSVLLSRLGAADGSFDTQITLMNGLVYAELRAAARYGYRIDAGGDVVTPVANATVRLSLDQPPAEIAVLDGTVHVRRGGAQGTGYEVDVQTGESLRADAAGGSRYYLAQRVEHNSWDDWNEEREQAAANDAAVRTAARNGYAGDQGYGWSDLDANGTWYDTGQGPVWQPFDAGLSGFDPYGYGSWVYVSGPAYAPGYVWSSGYRWGWTPFRCGNWSYWPGFGWGWRPGRVTRGDRINLSNVPPGYKRPLPPTPGGPVRVHPIIPVRTGPTPTGERQHAFEARQIAGETAMPLRTIGSGYTPRGGSAVGSSLRRDFPIDHVTRQPVMGSLTAPAGRRAPEIIGQQGGSVPAPAVSGVARGDRREEASRPAFPARSGVPANGASVPAGVGDGGRVRVHPGYERGTDRRGVDQGGFVTPVVPANGSIAPLNQVPAPLHSEPAPLHSEPAPLNTVPRLPAGPGERSIARPPASPPLMRSAPQTSVPAPPPVRSAPAPAAAAPAANAGREPKK